MENKLTTSCFSFSSGNFSEIEIQSNMKPMYRKEPTNSLNSSIYKEIDEKDYEKSEEKINEIDHFICNECYSCPYIFFNSNNSFDMKCCKEFKKLRFRRENFNNNYSYKVIENKIINLCYKKHENQKIICYCPDCEMDLCEECLRQNKKHRNHSIIYFNNYAEKKEKIKELIIKTGLNSEIGDIDWKNRKRLIESLLNSYKYFPSFFVYKSIESAINYLSDLNEKEQLLKIIKHKNELININNNLNFTMPIIEIIIIEQNFNDLSILKKLNLKNLKKLNLKGNFINNIEPLLYCEFDELETLDLEGNNLNYKSMKDFDRMKFKKINFINLYINEINSIKIFEKVSQFKTLTIFHVGRNLFDKEEIIKNENKKYDLKFLKNFGISGNFTDETIDFVSNLILTDLEMFYVNINNLSSLNFLKDINCPKLFKLWAIENKLTDYNDIMKLKYKDNIRIINLKGNCIKNIDNLLDFISKLPSLRELNLSANEINIKSQKNKKIIEEINYKFKDLKLIIDNQNEKN